MSGDLAQSPLPYQYTGVQARCQQTTTQMAGTVFIRHDSETRTMTQAQDLQFGETTEAAQSEHLVASGMTGDYIERTETDGARGPQYGYPLHFAHSEPQPYAQSSTANKGMAAVRLSIRSSTPPWPGSRLLLSFMPD